MCMILGVVKVVLPLDDKNAAMVYVSYIHIH